MNRSKRMLVPSAPDDLAETRKIKPSIHTHFKLRPSERIMHHIG
jgi:hypothetical protein